MSQPAASPRASLEVADIVRAHGQEFLARYRVPTDRRRVLADVASCRTATLGGHVERCDSCPHEKVAYNSCRNRHCPKCQGSVAARWMQDRSEELLDVPYFHVVFTLPDEIAAIALQNPRVVYGILFQAVGQTLQEVAATPKHLGAHARRVYSTGGIGPTTRSCTAGVSDDQPLVGEDRISGGAAYVGPEPASSSTSALCRARWRSLCLWHEVGSHEEQRLLPAGPSAQPRVPRQVYRAAPAGL